MPARNYYNRHAPGNEIEAMMRKTTPSLTVTTLRLLVLVVAVLAAGGAEQPKPEATPQRRTDLHGDPLPSGVLARLGTVRLRREDGVCCDFAFTPDGKALVSARNGKVVQFWDATTGRPLRALRHEKKFDAFALSANGKVLVSAGSGEITVWDVGDSKQVRRIKVAEIVSLAVAPDGKILASADGNHVIRLWDLTTGEENHQLAGRTGNACSILFAPDGKTLLWVGEDAAVHVWDVAAKRQVRKFGSHVRCLALSQDGTILAAGGSEVVNNTVEARLTLWDAATGRRRLQLRGHEHFVESVAFTPDGKTLASSEIETIHLWDVATGKEVRRIDKSGWSKRHLAFSSDGKTLASTAPANETVVRLWDVATGKPLQPAGPDGVVRAVAFSPDGRLVATGCWLGYDHPLRVWDAATGKPLWACSPEVGQIDRIVFTPDGKGLFTSGSDDVQRLWDARTGKEIRRYPISDSNGPVVEIALSADGKRLTAVLSEAGVDRSIVIVWGVQTGKRLLRRQGENPSLTNILSFSSDGEIAAEPKGKTLRLWEVATGRQLLSLEPSNLRSGAQLEESTAFSRDGRTVAAITFASARRGKAPQPAECTVHLWEVATGKPSLRIAAGKDRLEAVAFAPDGRTLATAGKGVLQLWDVATGKELLAYRGQEANVFLGALAFSPDGTKLIAGYLDSTALVWDLMAGRRRAGVPQKDLDRVDLDRLWSDLSSADAAKAHAALWALTAGRERTVAFLSERLRPTKEGAERIRRLIADLDSEQFTVREAARRTLEQLGSEAEPALRKALEAKPSLEVRKRVEALLARPRIVYSPEVARQIRAVQVLEYIGSKKARRHLQELAGGAPSARLTSEAKMAFQRLTSQTVLEP
jgi:WD40 repeat protein